MSEISLFQINRELRGLNNDKKITELAVKSQQIKWAELLKGNVGKDINDVLSGKVKVKLTFGEIISQKLRNYKKKITNEFKKLMEQYGIF